jgi:hypothetical protein
MTTIGGLVAGGWFATGGGGSPIEPTAGEIAAAVWGASTALYVTAGTFGAALQDGFSDTVTDVAAVKSDTAAILIDTGTTLDAKIDEIRVDTTELQTDWTNGGRLDVILDATLADTNELQSDWTNGGRLDTILDTTAASAASTASTLGANAISDATLDPDLDIYTGTVKLTDDASGTVDRWVVMFRQNDDWLTSGVTNPRLTVTNIGTEGVLLDDVVLTQVGSTIFWKYSAIGAERVTSGVTYGAEVVATISGSPRTIGAVAGRSIT